MGSHFDEVVLTSSRLRGDGVLPWRNWPLQDCSQVSRVSMSRSKNLGCWCRRKQLTWLTSYRHLMSSECRGCWNWHQRRHRANYRSRVFHISTLLSLEKIWRAGVERLSIIRRVPSDSRYFLSSWFQPFKSSHSSARLTSTIYEVRESECDFRLHFGASI